MKRIYLPISVFTLLLSFLFFLPRVNSVRATTANKTAAADTTIMSDLPTTNTGSSDTLQTGWQGAAKDRTLLQFDLSGIPSNATVNVATLSIYLSSCGGLAQNIDDLNVARNLASWKENEATWNNKPSFDIGSVLNRIAPCSAAGKYFNYDVKTFVADWVVGTYSNYGFTLYGKEGVEVASWVKIFYSKENSQNKPPKLTVDYTVPSPSPSVSSDGATSPDSDQGTGGSSVTTSPSSNQVTGGTNFDQEGGLESSGQVEIDSAASATAKKATQSSTEKEPTRILSTEVILIAFLIFLLVALVAGYIIYRRRKNRLSKKGSPTSGKQS